EYAREKLSAAGIDAERSAKERHGCFFAHYGIHEAIDALYGREGAFRRRELALELDNILAACRRAVERGDCATAVNTYRAAWEVLDLKGPVAFGAVLGTQVLGVTDLSLVQRATASLIRARALDREGSAPQAQALLEQTLKLLRHAGDLALE